ncbi:MAG: transglycosylase domain-containing protein [Clostridia bacterium]|nr:transglycosylase domain-containing protein [Clostridia bacterium]
MNRNPYDQYDAQDYSYTEDPAYQIPDEDDEDFQPEKPRTIFKPSLKKPNIVLSILVNTVRLFAIVILLGGLVLAGIVFGIAKGYVETAPTLDLAMLSEQDKTSFLYDSNGNVITDYKGTENRVMVNISAMPENLCNAFVAVEDARFYTHRGIDIKRIIGSFVTNFMTGSQQGGSTITQQLIKNTILSSEQSYKRKIQEAYLALQLETRYTKSQILECYLNTIYLGENYYGVQVAAQGYFGKDLSNLTLRECAMLAGLTTNPYYYNPRRNFYLRTSDTTDYHAITNDRTDYVLRCMYENQFITQAEYQAALDPSTAHVLEKSSLTGEGMYPYAHYVEYAVTDIVDCFLKLHGLEDNSENRAKMENELRTGGYRVTLAIDTDMQQMVEETIDNWDKWPALRDPSDKVYRTRNNDGSYDEIPQPQCAAVVLDYRSGELKAIVGSRYRPTARKTLNRATDMKMPIGSTIKPIAVYAPAIELGASPASVAYNIPVPIMGWKDSNLKDTWPRNYGGDGYVGPETFREAMRRSHNVAAAQVLLYNVGVERSVDFLLSMGVDRDHIDATPYGLSLGSSGITPLQLTVAYGTLCNGGVYQQPLSFLGISDSEGNVVYDAHAEQERRQVFRPSTAWLTVDMMKTVVSSGTGSAAKLNGQIVAGKTGTNSDQRGVTFVGATGWYVSAIWVGHDNYQPLSSKTTGNGSAAPIWKAYMEKIHKGLDKRDIIETDPTQLGLVKITTCSVSGQLATDSCYNDSMGYGVVTDYWYEPTAPQVYCQMHQSMNICNESGMMATDNCPYTSMKGVVVIPNGHPLSTYVNDPEYGAVVASYLGTASVYNYCGLHQYGYVPDQFYPEQQPSSDNALIPDAQALIMTARQFLNTLDPNSQHYLNLAVAISNLETLIYSDSPSIEDVAAGMAAVTQAMAGY